MNRREFIASMGGAVALAAVPCRAKAAGAVPAFAKGAVERPLPAEETSSGKCDQSGKESGK